MWMIPNAVADWRALVTDGDHGGNFFDPYSNSWATVTRATPKTIFDPFTGRIHDVPAGKLAVNPWGVYQSGGRGIAAVIEEARTNYLVNSYGAANDGSKWTTGWTVGKSIVGTPTLTIEQGVYGGTAQRIQYTGTTDAETYYTIYQVSSTVFASGESAMMSIYAKGASVGTVARMSIAAKSAGGSTLGTVYGSGLTLLAAFTRFSMAYTSLPVDTAYVVASFTVLGISPGDTIDITFDAAQLEKGAFPTSYIPTTTAAVTRNADICTVPTTGWNPAAGTIVGVANRFDSANTNNSFVYLRGVGNNAIYINDGYSVDDFRATIVIDNVTAETSSRLFSRVPHTFGVVWGSRFVSLVDGVESTNIGAKSLSTTFTNGYIGSISTGGNSFNGSIHRVIIYASALDAPTLASSDMTSGLLSGVVRGSLAKKLMLL